MLRAQEKRCLVDEDSDKPASERAFAAESWRVARGREAAVFDGLFGFLNAVEDAACDEMKQLAAARKLQLEGALDVFAGFAVGFEGATTDAKVELLDGSRGWRGFWGGVGHKHISSPAARIVCVCRGVRCIQDFYICPGRANDDQ